MERTHALYKILRPAEWQAFRDAGETAGAPVDLADGYIHFSTAAQLGETLRRHFGGEGPLVLLAVDPAAMADDLRWEKARGGLLFPHLYRRLRLDEVRAMADLPARDGGHALPDAEHLPPFEA